MHPEVPQIAQIAARRAQGRTPFAVCCERWSQHDPGAARAVRVEARKKRAESRRVRVESGGLRAEQLGIEPHAQLFRLAVLGVGQGAVEDLA